MGKGELGKVFQDGENIVNQGEVGDCMYVILSGKVEVISKEGAKDVRLAVRGEGEFFGEMALFERAVRSSTVRAKGEVRVLTIDQRMLMRKIQEDPSLAFNMLQKMSHRIRELSSGMAALKAADRRDWDARNDKSKG